MGNMNYAEHFDPEGSVRENFNTLGYGVLRNFVSRETCTLLADEAKKAHSDGNTHHDSQCPPSHTFRDLDVHTRFHNELTPIVSAIIGDEIYRTYNLGRIYIPGDFLPVHTDKAACEVSATVTLECDRLWPIWFSPLTLDKKISLGLDTGDCALYKGPDIPHWREELKGSSNHIQLFFHWMRS